LRDNAITRYWLANYSKEHCTLCGNWGVIDTREVMTPAGFRCGRLNWCICPNGQAIRKQVGTSPEQIKRTAT
jgi:hypothetical protein